MIGIIALLSASQALPWLDRNWINHQARREMLVAASVSTFEPEPRPRIRANGQIHLMLAPRERTAVARRAVGLGGPAGM